MKFRRTQSLFSSGYLPGQQPDLKLRRANVDLENLKPALRHNGRDEVVFEAADHQLYILDAVRLTSSDGTLPQPGDEISLGGLVGKVAYAETDGTRGRGGYAVGLMSASILAAMAIGGPVGIGLMIGGMATATLTDRRFSDDEALRRVSDTLASAPEGSMSLLEAQLEAKLGSADPAGHPSVFPCSTEAEGWPEDRRRNP